MSTADVFDFDAIARSGRVTDAHVLAMRRAYYEDGCIEEFEADKLFSIDETCEAESDAWPRFYVEVLTDYLVHQAEPHGYICEHQTDWLIAQLSRNGHIASRTELELLVKLLETAVEVPRSLVAFTLNEVKTAVLTGNGWLIGDAQLQPGVIGEAEVDLIRRVLYAAGGASNISISRAEAEQLFDLNDATAGEDNHWSWSDLFSKAIVSHVMAANNYQPTSREAALKIHNWLKQPTDGVAGFLGKMFSGEMAASKKNYHVSAEDDWQVAKLGDMQANIDEAQVVTSAEASWLTERMGRDGVLHENEKAVLRFIRDECPEIHAGLEPLLTKV